MTHSKSVKNFTVKSLLRTTALVSTLLVSAVFAAPAVKAAEQVEVLHWWTSGGEGAALGVLKKDLETKGIGWVDMPVAGGAGDAAMTVLRGRVTGGTPPTAAQLLGFDLRDWQKLGVLANLDAVAEKNGWDKVIPKALQDFSKYNGQWTAVPVNVHTTNWVWINKAAFDKAGGKVPTDWKSFVALLEAMKKNGITPFAQGGQNWQEATVFEAIVLSLGTDFYKKAMIDQDPAALNSPMMVEAFDRLRVLRGYTDANFSNRDWNLATAMVIKGDAGLQMMGDWAKGEFLRAGLKPGKDFICMRFPGTQGALTFNADQFAMFKVGAAQVNAQNEMAKAVLDPKFQSAFNVVKGSVPARIDVKDTDFDDCGKKGMKDLAEASKNGTLFGSMAHGYAAPAPVKGAVFDVVDKFFNDNKMTSAAAAAALAKGVAAAKN